MKRKDSKFCKRCNKTRYKEFTVAARVALHSSRLRGVGLRIYPCPIPDAKGYHLTKEREYHEQSA